MNSIVGPIFNEKVAEKWNLWVHEQCTMCTDWLKKWEKSNFVVKKKLFVQYMNSSHKSHKHVLKKKKNEEKEKCQMQTPNPNVA